MSPSESLVEFNSDVLISFLLEVSSKVLIKFSFNSLTKTLSCGLFGPAKEGLMSVRSNSKIDENIGSLVLISLHIPWALAYASTNSSVSISLPVNLR